MITKEPIKSESGKVPEEWLDELFRLVRTFTTVRPESDGQSLMSRLKRIQINAPADFSANLDQYLNGEKSIDWSFRGHFFPLARARRFNF